MISGGPGPLGYGPERLYSNERLIILAIGLYPCFRVQATWWYYLVNRPTQPMFQTETLNTLATNYKFMLISYYFLIKKPNQEAVAFLHTKRCMRLRHPFAGRVFTTKKESMKKKVKERMNDSTQAANRPIQCRPIHTGIQSIDQSEFS